jgi:predicted DNA-binding ribbon-helix-helix protein
MAAVFQRMLAFPEGKRMPIKLDAATWKAIDWLAEQAAITWQSWCAAVVSKMEPDENVTAAIREAAMSLLLEETIFADRAEQLAIMEAHPLMKNSGVLNDEQLADTLAKARVAGHFDFGGFSVFFGLDEHYQDCIWIKNGLRDGLHFAFAFPIKRVDK